MSLERARKYLNFSIRLRFLVNNSNTYVAKENNDEHSFSLRTSALGRCYWGLKTTLRARRECIYITTMMQDSWKHKQNYIPKSEPQLGAKASGNISMGKSADCHPSSRQSNFKPSKLGLHRHQSVWHHKTSRFDVDNEMEQMISNGMEIPNVLTHLRVLES